MLEKKKTDIENQIYQLLDSEDVEMLIWQEYINEWIISLLSIFIEKCDLSKSGKQMIGV